MASLGEVGAAIGRENRDRVREFFELNPFSSQRDCAEATGLSPKSVNGHVKKLKAELQARRQKASA